MTRQRIPEDVLTAAHDRAKARAAHDWPEADRLRDVIEAAGWKVVDHGTDFALSPAAPPDVADDARIRYGASRNVPSRLEAAPVGLATILLLATDWPGDLARALAGIRRWSPPGTSIVIVADGPSEAQAKDLDVLEAPADDLPVRGRVDQRPTGARRRAQRRAAPSERPDRDPAGFQRRADR